MSASVPPTISHADSRKGKPGLSCAECRRSKLKCDRNFPCQSCIRRGCAAICPDGTLAATKGNKVLMAHAERLTAQVKTMSARIKELEATLANAQKASLPSGNEPVSQLEGSFQDSELTGDKYERDLDSVSKNLGSLAIDGEGKAQYYGVTAGAEFLQHLMPAAAEVSNTVTIQEPKNLGLPQEILELVYAFPFGFPDRAFMIPDFLKYIPFRDRAVGLADLYYTHAAWFYDPVPRGDFEQTILEPLYCSVNDIVPLVNFEPHRLSVFFMVLGTGALFDSHPNARKIAEQYHAFACATYSLESIVGGATCASIQTLLMMAHFLFLTDRSGNERRWLLKGLCTKVIQMIGLQRDCAGWNLTEEEIQRRRTIFWEFFTWECWACVIHGRPPTLNLAHSDCRFPRDLQPHLLPSGKTELSFHSWKFRYSAVCLSVSVQRAFSVHQESYASLLELDKRIRSFPLPTHVSSPAYETGRRDWDTNSSNAMQQYMAACSRESNLIYIHRSWFAEALRDSPDPLQHEYGQSVLAVFRSASILINGLRSLASAHPKLVGRIWFFWSSFYTSSVLLGAIVVKSPGCKLARGALSLLDQSVVVYEEGSRLCRPPATMPMLNKLRRRAYHTYSAYASTLDGEPQAPLPFTAPDDIHDLSAFGGTKGSVISRSPTNSPQVSAAPSPDSSSLLTVSTDITAIAAAHPPRSSQSPISLSHSSPLTFSSGGSSPPRQSDSPRAVSYGSIPQAQAGFIPGPSQPPQFGMPYPTGTPQDPIPTQGAPDFGPSLLEQQNTLLSLPTREEILDIDLEELGLPLGPQPMQYSQFPQLEQFQDILMGDSTAARPPQIPQDDAWWQFVDDLGIQRI
ncbi:fungal-specific transcription factor domain-containing protein [Russula dissimulans]|nr:fungal-specific transcription factor domain-containing protein [Russula dissimulans]